VVKYKIVNQAVSTEWWHELTGDMVAVVGAVPHCQHRRGYEGCPEHVQHETTQWRHRTVWSDVCAWER